MKFVRHLLKMTSKVYNERGVKELLVRIFVFIKNYAFSLTYLPGDILYVSGCPGGSRFYRCYNQAEELRRYNISAQVVSQDLLGLLYLTSRYKIFVFQRVIYNEHIVNVIDAIKKQGKIILFETDDLVFDSSYLPYMHYYNYMGKEEKGWYENGIGRELLENSFVENCIVSTEYLAKAIKEKYQDKKIFISSNKLNKNQVRWALHAFKRKKKIKNDDGKIRIGYFSGSRSHDADFETISDVLVRILRENKKVILMIVGHLELDEKFFEVKDQIEYHSFVPMKKLAELILLADINIAPLEIDNPFCQSKSALKFFEAGLLGVPTVATATSSFCDVIEDGRNGFVAKDSDEWYRKISILLHDENILKALGMAAHKDSLDKHTTQNNHPEMIVLVEFIKKEIKRFSL